MTAKPRRVAAPVIPPRVKAESAPVPAPPPRKFTRKTRGSPQLFSSFPLRSLPFWFIGSAKSNIGWRARLRTENGLSSPLGGVHGAELPLPIGKLLLAIGLDQKA